MSTNALLLVMLRVVRRLHRPGALPRPRCGLAMQRRHLRGADFLHPVPDLLRTGVGVAVGDRASHDYRMYFRQAAAESVSPWHEVPLFAGPPEDGVVHFINEIPRGTRAKMEIATDEPGNPIKQDIKKGKLRDYAFDSLVNYGALPQTWEDPDHVDPVTRYSGDNDPLDVVEIGERVVAQGTILRVKVLGVLGMIDEGEMDWKIIAIDVEDPLASRLRDIEDVHALLPGRVAEVHDWFRDYKIPDGKPPSEFAFGGEAKGRAFALDVIRDTHESWRLLMAGKAGGQGLSLQREGPPLGQE